MIKNPMPHAIELVLYTLGILMAILVFLVPIVDGNSSVPAFICYIAVGAGLLGRAHRSWLKRQETNT